jgi:hypothetical protein
MLMDGVGVGEEQPLSVSLQRRSPAALFLPVNPPRLLGSSGGASRTVTPACFAAISVAIAPVVGGVVVDDDQLPVAAEFEAARTG